MTTAVATMWCIQIPNIHVCKNKMTAIGATPNAHAKRTKLL